MKQRLIFLQNAWSPAYAGRRWPRESWLRALQRSRSGQRLATLVGTNWEWCDNITPEVGDNPDSVLPADAAHIQSVLSARKPDVVIACGRHAERALLKLWHGPMVCVPHPAHRLLTNLCYAMANDIIADGFQGHIALRLTRSGCVREQLISTPTP